MQYRVGFERIEMVATSTVQGTAQKPQYARAKSACAHFGISRSTLWQWCKTRRGFPQPLKAGAKVTLFDINAIDAFIKADAAK
jgi:predicted DNA-binding transcriptional regulator AlpA